MKRWTIDELINQVKDNQIIEKNLLVTNEFKILTEYLYTPEQILGLLVCAYNEEPHLLVLTDFRLFLIQQTNVSGFKVEQFGLEQIVDLQTYGYGSTTTLIFSFNNQKEYHLMRIKNELALMFKDLVLTSLKKWKEQIS